MYAHALLLCSGRFGLLSGPQQHSQQATAFAFGSGTGWQQLAVRLCACGRPFPAPLTYALVCLTVCPLQCIEANS